jgi:polyhydroxyalkanoate synthesis regulator phasin
MIESIQSSNKSIEDKYQNKIKEATEEYESSFKSMEKDLSEKLYDSKR